MLLLLRALALSCLGRVLPSRDSKKVSSVVPPVLKRLNLFHTDMPPAKDVVDEEFVINTDTDRRIRRRAASSRAIRTGNTENQSTFVETQRPRRCATRRTHLENGDCLLFHNEHGVYHPLNESFEDYEAI